MSTFKHVFDNVGEVTFHLPDIKRPLAWGDLTRADQLQIEISVNLQGSDWKPGRDKTVTLLGQPGGLFPIPDLAPSDRVYPSVEALVRNMLYEPGFAGRSRYVDIGVFGEGQWARFFACDTCTHRSGCIIGDLIQGSRSHQNPARLHPDDMRAIESMVHSAIQKYAEDQEKTIRRIVRRQIGFAFLVGFLVSILALTLIPIIIFVLVVYVLYRIVKKIIELILWIARNLWYAVRWPFIWARGFFSPEQADTVSTSDFIDPIWLGVSARRWIQIKFKRKSAV